MLETILSLHGQLWLVEIWEKASVYRFGQRWHWKCGHKSVPSRCHGGPAWSRDAAHAHAVHHLVKEHARVYAVRVDPDACKLCDRPAAAHSSPEEWSAPPLGHWHCAPSEKRRQKRLADARRTRVDAAFILDMIKVPEDPRPDAPAV